MYRTYFYRAKTAIYNSHSGDAVFQKTLQRDEMNYRQMRFYGKIESQHIKRQDEDGDHRAHQLALSKGAKRSIKNVFEKNSHREL